MKRLLILLTIMAATAGPAAAVPVTFDYTVDITSIGPGAALSAELAGVSAPLAITGSYTFDSERSSVPSFFGVLNYGFFFDAFELNVGDATYSLIEPGSGFFRHGDNTTTAGSRLPLDIYRVDVVNQLQSAAGNIVSAVFWLTDQTDLLFETDYPDALTDNLLPVTAPDISLFENNLFRVFVDGQIALQGSLTSLTTRVAVVPEPGVLMLLAIGLFGIAAGCRRG